MMVSVKADECRRSRWRFWNVLFGPRTYPEFRRTLSKLSDSSHSSHTINSDGRRGDQPWLD